jgi:anti-anti-sigma factor
VSALIIRVRTAPIPTLVTVAGEVDLLTAPQLRDQVRTLPDGDVVLDISGVRLLAAAGLRVLLDLHDRRARAGAQVVLAAARPSVHRVLRVTGVEQALPMIATLDEAVTFVTGAQARQAQRLAFPLSPRRSTRVT